MIENCARILRFCLALVLCAPSAFGQCARLADTSCGFLLGGQSLIHSIQYGKADITEPFGLTNDGRVVGYYSDHARDIAGFLYDHGIYTRISYGNDESAANGINNSGNIVGFFYGYKNNQYTYFGYVKIGDSYSVLDYPPAQATGPYGINDSNIIVGEYHDNLFGPVHGFVYANGVLLNSIIRAQTGLPNSQASIITAIRLA